MPPLTLILGGARSGKSRFAERLVETAAVSGTYCATAEPGDAEMKARIAAHRARRGAFWHTVEAPLALADAIAAEANAARPLLVDCLTLWLSNLMMAQRPIDEEFATLRMALRDAAGPVVLVANEVGLGLVPETPLGRAFRDNAGHLNQEIGALADRVVFVAAGLPLVLKAPAAAAKSPSPPFRGEREGPAPKAWEGEVGIGERSGIPTSPQPSPPPGAERGKSEEAEAMRRIPATIVTGFLGAGKTSLVRHLLSTAAGYRLAIIVNEFGELGIDRELLLGCGEEACSEGDIIELANGCLCCTVADDFLPTLGRLIDRAEPPDHIVVETSGLALPKPLVQAFAWPQIRTRMTVDGVVTVIDAAAAEAGRFAADPEAVQRQRDADPAIGHDNPLEEVFGDQLACADLVILNKTDLIAPDRLAALHRDLEARLRPGVKLVTAERGMVMPAVALGLAASAEDDLAARPSCHDLDAEHDHDDFDSFVVERGPVADDAAFRARLAALIRVHDVLRVKGFLDVPGRDRRQVVQAVGDRIEQHFDRAWRSDECRASRLVVIGRKGIDRAAIRAALMAGA
ncbi:MAG TPA: cobalamin biosynthesis protein CobW [Stellaceae bacterium]|nr:cobalamin biosynthesis protein CobW [Stellaceae bacterium]